MSALAGIALYNPDRLNEGAFVAGFVARIDLVEFLLDKLRKTPADAVAEHQLVIGLRGMGKTSLLRRLAIGIGQDASLKARYVALRFREEQYNVLTLDDFWRNCCEALAEWCEANDHGEIAARLDRLPASAEWRNPGAALECLLAETKGLGRRPLLLVDNLDLITTALSADKQWALRRTLQAPGGPIIVGAATQLLPHSGDRDAAFYEFFSPHVLEALSKEELVRCMRSIADGRGEAGKPVLETLAKEPERIRSLHALTGGNPRVLALIYRLLEGAESDSVMADLEILLDQVTPYYKARVEEYQTNLQRAVIDAVALNWHPITSKELSKATATEITTISSQLSRLKNDGLIEEVPTSGTRSGHQFVERFFNIWYLMRHGTRRAKQKVRWLAEFLASFYKLEELRRIVSSPEIDDIRKHWHPLYGDAIAAAMEIVSNQAQSPARPAAEPQPSTESRAKSESELRQAIRSDPDNALIRIELGLLLAETLNSPEEAIDVCDEVVQRFGDSYDLSLREHVARALLVKTVALEGLNRNRDAIEICEDIVRRLGEATEGRLPVQVAIALRQKSSQLVKLGLREEAISTNDEIISRFGDLTDPMLQGIVGNALIEKGVALGQLNRSEQAIGAFDEVVRRSGDAGALVQDETLARALIGKGMALGWCGRHGAAIVIYEEVVRRFGDVTDLKLRSFVAVALFRKGVESSMEGRFDEAIGVYSEIVQRFGDAIELELRKYVARALVNRGSELRNLGRIENAISTCDEVFRRFGDAPEPELREAVSRALNLKGDALADQLGKFDEAKQAYLESLRILPDDARVPRINLVWAYLATARVAEAETLRLDLGEVQSSEVALIDAAIAIVRDNFGAAADLLGRALDDGQTSDATDGFDTLLRFLRLAEARGYGERLIAWFEASRHAEPLAPLYAAFVAYVGGERFLLDINPEVRQPARQIYQWFNGHRRKVDVQEARPPAKSRRGRPQKRRGQ